MAKMDLFQECKAGTELKKHQPTLFTTFNEGRTSLPSPGGRPSDKTQHPPPTDFLGEGQEEAPSSAAGVPGATPRAERETSGADRRARAQAGGRARATSSEDWTVRACVRACVHRPKESNCLSSGGGRLTGYSTQTTETLSNHSKFYKPNVTTLYLKIIKA